MICLLAIILMGLMTFNTTAAEAVAELTRYDTASLNDFPELVTDKTVAEYRLLERRKEDEGNSLNTLAYKKEDGQNVAFVYPYDVKYAGKSYEAMKSCNRHYAGDSSIILYHNLGNQ